MIRSLLYSLATLAVLIGAFLLYWRMQPATTAGNPAGGGGASGSATAPTTAPTEATQLMIGRGENAWLNSFDDRGRLASQFTAAQYAPQPDQSFKAVRPVWVFYLDDGQFMAVAGDTGTVYVAGATGTDPRSTSPLPVSMQAPSRGILHQVHIALFPSRGADRPTLWLDVNNIAFDNDTLRLYTQGYIDESGANIPADRVPVTVRGDDYEFDGSGLTLNWNDRDRRLQLLEIAHGGRLMIKNPAKMSTPWSGKAATTAGLLAPSPGTPGAGRGGGGQLEMRPLSEALVDADQSAARAVIAAATPKPPATSPTPPSPYRAIFNDAVRVEQGDRQLATGDVMTVDFLPSGGSSSSSKDKAATKPQATAAKAAATRPSAADEDLAHPKPPPAAERLASTATTTPALSAPATSKSKEKNPPVTIYWTGKLRITPIESGPPLLPLASGQAAVRLVGSPVELTPQGAIVHAAAVSYRNDGAMVLENSDKIPLVELKQDRGTTFVTETLNYDPATRLATIVGRSDMTLPVAGQKAMAASWTRRGLIHFTGGSASQPERADRVDLDGHVTVTNADFSIKSNQLGLDLDKAPPAPPPPPPLNSSKASSSDQMNSDVVLKRATAVGDVVCRMMHAGRADRGIDGDRLVLETAPGPDGKPQPHTVVADGSVHAFDPQQQIDAGHLEAVLLPKPPAAPAAKATKSSDTASNNGVDVESVLASSNVRAVLKAGAIANADELRVTMKNGKTIVELHGGDSTPATIGDGKGSTLSGMLMHISPERSLVTVDGPGTMHSLRRSSPREPGRPMDVSWNDSVTYDGVANMIDVIGQVKVVVVDPKGPTDSMAGDSAHLDLVDAVKPATRSAKTAATTDTGGFAGGDKEIKAMAITGHMHGESTLTGPDGKTLLRHGEITGPKLTYDSASGRTEVPGPGLLTVEDHRKGKDAAGPRGAMAVQWKDKLVYDDTAHQVIVTGDTLIGFQRDEKDAVPMQLASQRVTVDLVPPKAGGTTGPTAAAAAGATSMQISHLRAEEKVRFTGRGLTVSAQSIDDDPATERAIARGTTDAPVQVLDESGASTGMFDEVVFNTRTQEIESTKGTHVQMRH
jgi:hypothetical protein